MNRCSDRRRAGAAGWILLHGIFAAMMVSTLVAQVRRVEPAEMVRPPLNLAPTGVEAEVLAALPRYVPQQKVSGTIRLWGHGSFKRPFMQRLVTLWAEDFRRWHPDCRIEQNLYGTSSAIPALFTGVGDMSILGEEILAEATDTFTRATGYPPFGVDIATGSVDVRNFDYAQVFFVHRDNPLTQITLAQLDAVFGAEHRRGAPGNFRTWGDLGLTGEWSTRPIQPYGWRIDDSFGIYLETYLLGGSHRWNNALREFAHRYNPDGTIYDHGQQILDALAQDRFGIAVSNLRYAGADVRPLALAADAASPGVLPTKRTLIDGTYPLTRRIPAYINRPPGQPIPPAQREFLRYLLSREGQGMIIRDGGYLPLNPRTAAEQRSKLE